MFYEGFQHCLQFCLSHLNCVKMVVSSTGEAKKSHREPNQTKRMGAEWHSYCFLIKNPLVRKEVRDGVLSWCNNQLNSQTHVHFLAYFKFILKFHTFLRLRNYVTNLIFMVRSC
jgi:hypothetical protein